MERLYLDNAASSWPKAPGMDACLAEAAMALPGRGIGAAGGTEGISACRTLLCELLGMQNGGRIALTANATYALNMALMGFPWKNGDVVLTTVAEHNSVLRPLYTLKKRGMIRDFVKLSVGADGRIREEALEKALQNLHPRMFVFAHANPVTGAVNDVRALAALCRKYGANTMLDASQTAGLLPMPVEEWNIDMLAGSGHKYLLGPTGTGFLFIGEGVELAPLIFGATPSHADRWTMPDELPWRLEAGSANELGFSALAYSLRWNKDHPAEICALDENILILENGLREAGASPVRVSGQRIPSIAFTSPVEPARMGEILRGSYDVYCSMGLHQCPLLLPWLGFDERGSVRFSLSRFNTREEILELIEIVNEILHE